MRMTLTRLLILTTTAAFLRPASAQEGGEWAALVGDAARWAEAALPADLDKRLALPSAEEILRFARLLQQDLESGQVEDLARWLPAMELGAQLLKRAGDTSEYAPWIEQQLDYVEMAAYAVAGTPETRSPMTPGPVMFVPPSRPGTRLPVPVATQRKHNDLIQDETLWQSKVKGRPLPAQAARLVPLLKSVFKEEGLPPAAIWLAEVESTMNPQARNPAGAAGLFQLMPATAQRFGLSLSPTDERLDPSRSARAAARYLRFLHSRFAGWPLAFAAYNCGEGRLGSLLAASRQRTFAAIAPDLPLETRMYVPKINAVLRLREGVRLTDLPPPSLRPAALPLPDSPLALDSDWKGIPP